MTLAWMVLASSTLAFQQQPSDSLESLDQIHVYVELVRFDRSTREHWEGQRLDAALFRDWLEAIVRDAAEKESFLQFVEDREEADVLLQISRCQKTEDEDINISERMKIGARSETFDSYMTDVNEPIEGLEIMLSWMMGRRKL